MKKFFLLIIPIISTVYPQQRKDYLNATDIIASAESRSYSRISLLEFTSASQNFDVKYYRCEWQVDPALRYIAGKITSYFLITVPADYISFDLMDSLVVDSVTKNNNILSFQHVNNTLKVNFPSSINAGILDSLSH